MKGTSKVIMGATLITVLSLAIVLGLILVLLAELYCSLLVRRRATTSLELPTAAEASPITIQSSAAAPPFSRFYSHGVINAPRNFLFPSLASKEENDAVSDTKKTQHSQLSQFLDCSSKPRHSSATTSVRILSSKPPSPTADAESSQLQAGEDANGSSKEDEHLVYISNPVFDECSGADTPYATPDTSPSRLGNTSGSSDEDDEITNTPQSNARLS
ncbi:unnamed protein product [Rhodiola kirilowii]